MAYEYDCFFSYKRDQESDEWHRTVKKKIQHWLQQELGRSDVSIFFDTEEVHSGERWQARVADALRRSKCLVCVWSPPYFQSRWCVSEWMSFVDREKQVGRSLIVPASYFDGENFPAVAKTVQTLDFSPFASTMPGFWLTSLAVDFETQRLRPFAHHMAQAIQNAPPYDDGFPIHFADEGDVQGVKKIGRLADV